MAEMAQLRVPIQAKPVDRYEVPKPFLIDFGPFKIIPEVDPQPDFHSYFSREVDQATAICSILSTYTSCLRSPRVG